MFTNSTKVNTISRPIVDSKFTDTTTHRFTISKIAETNTIDPDTNFNYAKLRDDIGGRVAPPNFSGRILAIAKELLVGFLEVELQAIAP